MRRLEAYNEYELENYTDGLLKMQEFISTTQQKDIIYLDYMTMSRYYVKTKNYSQSIEYFQKAIALNDRQPEAYKEIANAYCMSFEYAKSIPNFEKYFEMNPNYLNMDLYMYSDACINSAGKYVDTYDKNFTSEQVAVSDREFMTHINKAITANDSLIKRAPDSYLGFYGKAKAYSWIDAYEKKKTDKIEGVAKPHYDQAVLKLEASNTDGKLNAYVIDAYRYYSGYYIMKDDVKNTIEINKKILDIDPNDSRAIEILKTLKVKLPKKK
jgi:tetratricopeptide (TPR) repeat protein